MTDQIQQNNDNHYPTISRLETVQKGYGVATEDTDTALREYLEHLPIGRFWRGL